MNNNNCLIKFLWCVYLFLTGSTLSFLWAQARSGWLPFVVEGKEWLCNGRYYDRELKDNVNFIYSYKMQGDTVLGGKQMKKVYHVNKPLYGDEEPHYFGAVAEEGSKVSIVYADSTDSQLIYNIDPANKERFYIGGPGTHLYAESWQSNLFLVSSVVRRMRYVYGLSTDTNPLWQLRTFNAMIEGVGLITVDPFRVTEFFETNMSFRGINACIEAGLHIYLHMDAYPALYSTVSSSYRPLLKEGRSWQMQDGAVEFIQGDTLLTHYELGEDGIKSFYYKVYRIDKAQYGDERPRYVKAMREDSFVDEGIRVYEVPDGMSYKDRILRFCFRLPEHERVPLPDGREAEVIAIDTISNSGQDYRRYTLSLFENGQSAAETITWTEGIGGDHGLSGATATTDMLQAVYDGEECIYLSTTTGICHLPPAASTHSCLYDLQGRRLAAPPAKGIYVKDGRKVMVKR